MTTTNKWNSTLTGSSSPSIRPRKGKYANELTSLQTERMSDLTSSSFISSLNMRSMSIGDSSSNKSSKPVAQGAVGFQQCELKVVNSLLKTNFVKVNSNLTLNSTFKTPNIKSYDLLKEDFYVRWPSHMSVIALK